MSDRRGKPGEGDAPGQVAAADVATRRRPSADPEALGIAIGARREALDAAAAADLPHAQRETPDHNDAAQRTPTWRQAAAIAAVLLMLAVAGGGVYWAVPRLALGPPDVAQSPAPDAAARTLTRAEKRRVERLLKRLDFRVGAVDGRIDARTRAALIRYRRYQGVADPHARLTPNLLADLRAVAARVDGNGPASAP